MNYQELLHQWSKTDEGKKSLKKCGESGDWALLSFANWLDEHSTIQQSMLFTSVPNSNLEVSQTMSAKDIVIRHRRCLIER